MTKSATGFWVIIAVAVLAFILGTFFQKDRTETQVSESRSRQMRVELCTEVCRVQEQPMLGVAEEPEWRCFCKGGYWQPLP